MREIAHWEENEGCTIVDVLYAGTMDVGVNRNRIVKEFRRLDVEWLFWVDSDNAFKPGSIQRLMNVALHGENLRTLVGGLYYSKFQKPWPIAYQRFPDGRYEAIEGWKYGEIIPAAAMGMHSLLSHRSVYDDILKNYSAVMRIDGGVLAIHNDDIEGDMPENRIFPQDGKVIDGVWHQRVVKPPIPTIAPIFSLAHQRTEDFGFYEMAARLGHQLWVDTGVESTHQRVKSVTGKTYRDKKRKGEMTHGGPKLIGH